MTEARGTPGGQGAVRLRVSPAGSRRPRVVIVGGGFGGLYTAKALAEAPVDVVLIDRRNFHLFQPLLYQVATGGLSPANIASPLRQILGRQANTSVVLGEVTDLRPERRQVMLGDEALDYDYLVLATGSTDQYFGHDEWAGLAPGLKTIEDALGIRRRILLAFEHADQEDDEQRRRALLTFVIVGGGPTGVELAGAIAEIARLSFGHEYRNIRPGDARIYLIEAADRVLPPFPPSLAARAAGDLASLGVTVWTQTRVQDIGPGLVRVERGGSEERLEAGQVLWAAGVKASPLGAVAAARLGLEPDRGGRVIVDDHLNPAGHEELFVIGDLAHFEQGGKPVPGVAPVAMQQGHFVAEAIVAGIQGRQPPRFRYRNRGSLATIGRSHAVAHLGLLKLSGHVAWLFWLFVHLMYLSGFVNRLLVLTQWAWSYWTRGRSARLITGGPFATPGAAAAARQRTSESDAAKEVATEVSAEAEPAASRQRP